MSHQQAGTGDASARMALMELAIGAMVGQAVHVAAKLGIADQLVDRPKTPAELAEATGARADTLHRLLRALASRGVFAETADGRFALTPVAEGLRSAAPGSLRAYAVLLGEDWLWRAWGQLSHSVRTGQSALEHALRPRCVRISGRAPRGGVGLRRRDDEPDAPGDRCRRRGL